jgi:hypothetical protein
MHLFPLTVPVCVFDPSNTSLAHVFLTPGAGLCHRWHASISESHNIDNLTRTKFSNPIHQNHLSVTAVCDVALALLEPADETWRGLLTVCSSYERLATLDESDHMEAVARRCDLSERLVLETP